MSSLSILIATHNRAEILRETLEAMSRVDRTGLDVEWVIIDNNSTDHTKEVVESFTGKLPVRYLFEGRPGKNCALNRALDSIDLGELVVFTDDDITPLPDWLRAATGAATRWPNHYVFGGRIRPQWPTPNPPTWALTRWVQVFGYALHDLGEVEQPYASNALPFGGNFWVRSGVFSNGRRYSEQIGPTPKNRKMGSETSFLKQLRADGFEPIYVPASIVDHRVQQAELTQQAILRRAATFGRGNARLTELPDRRLLHASAGLWKLRRVASLAFQTTKCARARLIPNFDSRIQKQIAAEIAIAREREWMQIAAERAVTTAPPVASATATHS